MPADLAKPDEITKDERFKTTSGTAHDHKHSGGPFGNLEPRYGKAPGHWKVNYVKDLHEKVLEYHPYHVFKVRYSIYQNI